MEIKNYTLKFFIVLLGLLFTFCPIKIVAVNLEVVYPTTVTGSTLTTQSDLAQYLKYVFDFGISISLSFAFLSLVIAGILYFIAPAAPGALAIAKDRISGAISGILILLLAYLIITTINPYLSIFKTNPLEDATIQGTDTQFFGVNFYNSKDCSKTAVADTQNIADFGEQKNKINSVKILQNSSAKTYYISILYDNTNYWGKCQYINPTTAGCQKTNVSVASASIYTYDFSPKGNGFVDLYRESFNTVIGKEKNKDAGYLRISSLQIGKGYFNQLSSLSFTGTSKSDCTVPEKERECVKWSDAGNCKEYKCPTLDKENITSIKISGDYIVLLLYIDPKDIAAANSTYTYTYCQAFPTKDDATKDGPQQIKWDAIRSSGYSPNYIFIIPVTQK